MTTGAAGDGAAASVTLRYRLEPGEAVAANRLWSLRVFRPLSYLFVVIFPIAGWVGFAREGAALWIYPAWLVVGAVLLGIWYLVSWVGADLIARWTVRRSAARFEIDELCFVFDDKSVTLETDPVTQRLVWSATRGFLLTERFIFIRVTTLAGYFIPTRVCDAEQFRAVLRVAPDWLPILRRRPYLPSEVVRRGAVGHERRMGA